MATYISSSPTVVNVRLPVEQNESATSSVFADAGRIAQLGRLDAPAVPWAMPALSAASNTSVDCAGVTASNTTSALNASLAAGAYATAAGARSSVGMPGTSPASR